MSRNKQSEGTKTLVGFLSASATGRKPIDKRNQLGYGGATNEGNDMTASWVIVDRLTGQAVRETFSKHNAGLVRERCSDTHDVVTILDYLHKLNEGI